METQLANIVRIDSRDPMATRLACDSMDRHGFAILDGLMSAEKVQALHREFVSRCPQYLEDVKYPETSFVGLRRWQVPIALRDGFADPEVYGHPVIVATIRELLGEDALLEAFGGVVSLGYAPPQLMHRDGPFLFSAEVSTHLPCHAITFSLPLVALDKRVGTTALWPGSHRREQLPNLLEPHHKPDIPLGSALIWDFRIGHRGESNFTETARPLVYATYGRAWYRDHRNFRRPGLTALNMDEDFLRSLPEDRRGLFAPQLLDLMSRDPTFLTGD